MLFVNFRELNILNLRCQQVCRNVIERHIGPVDSFKVCVCVCVCIYIYIYIYQQLLNAYYHNTTRMAHCRSLIMQ